MSIDQCRKKAMRGCRTLCNDGGYITIQDGLGHNDPWSLSAGHSVDRTDPDLFKKGWINDPDLEREGSRLRSLRNTADVSTILVNNTNLYSSNLNKTCWS